MNNTVIKQEKVSSNEEENDEDEEDVEEEEDEDSRGGKSRKTSENSTDAKFNPAMLGLLRVGDDLPKKEKKEPIQLNRRGMVSTIT